MPRTQDDPSSARRRDRAPDGEAWDDGSWVDVGADAHWRPTFEERSRSAVVFAVIVGVLLLAAAFASIDDGDGDDEADVVAVTSSSTPTTQPTTSTTRPPSASSIDGATPPEGCEDDNREALPFRDRSDTAVLVLNGTPRGGHAGVKTNEVQALDYSTMEPDNAAIRPTTNIEFLPGHCAEAVRLGYELGIGTATVHPLPEDSDVFLGRAVLVLTLGRDSL